MVWTSHVVHVLDEKFLQVTVYRCEANFKINHKGISWEFGQGWVRGIW